MTPFFDESDIQIEFLEKILEINAVKQLENFVLNFFMDKFKLSNCVILTNTNTLQKVSNTVLNEAYTQINTTLSKQLLSMRSPFVVEKISSDFAFKNIEGIQNLPQCVIALPLVFDKDFFGCLVCYSDVSLAHLLDLFSWLCSKISVSLHRIAIYSAVEHSAFTDSLTNLHNRFYFDAVAGNMLENSKKNNSSSSLILFDIDNFKVFNDTKGHLAGDELLTSLGSALSSLIPENCLACRYGGEEFAIFLPDTKSDSSFETSEKIRNAVSNNLFITISCGVVSCLNSSVDLVAMFKEADIALYKAKGSGKNKSCLRVIVDKNISVIDAEEAGSVGKS